MADPGRREVGRAVTEWPENYLPKAEDIIARFGFLRLLENLFLHQKFCS